jgi:uncharacterized protein YggE
VKAKPDLVRIRFKVIRLEQTASDSFASASEGVHGVRQALRDHDIPDAAVNRSELSLKTLLNYQEQRRFLGYQSMATFSVESADLNDVQQLVIDLVAAGANEIDGVDFDVRAKPDLRAEARRAAVAAARRKAELYAEAAGVRLGPVLHIDDVDVDNPSHQSYKSHAAYAGEASAEDLAPGHVVVSAAVFMGYAIQAE